MNFKINIGGKTEAEVQRFVESAFSPFFVFRAPRKGEDQKEVTDILVLWDDVALIIQVKAQALSDSGGESDDSLKWAKKNLSKAGRQIAGAVRAIRDGRMPHMVNPLRGKVPFPGQEIKWLYGVIVLHHLSRPYDPFLLVPELQRTTVPLHVLSFRDFYNLAHFLDTPADLINYFEDRSDVLLQALKPKVHDEESVFDYWLNNLESLMEFRARNRGVTFEEKDARPYAEGLRRLVSGQLPVAAAGAVIDHMIERAHEQDSSLGPIRYGEAVFEMAPAASVKVATELSKITRLRRIALGQRYLRTIQLGSESWKSTHSPKRSDCMLFLASPLPKNQRDERRQRLLSMTLLLKHYHQVKKAMGIATEAGEEEAGRSYDFIYIESDPIENEEAFLIAKATFGEPKGLLTDEPSRGDSDSR